MVPKAVKSLCYVCCILGSTSQVASLIGKYLHWTFTELICLENNCLVGLSRIAMGFSLKDKSLSNTIESHGIIFVSSGYLFNMETWNTLWTIDKCEGKVILYVTFLYYSRISKGPMGLRLRFTLF